MPKILITGASGFVGSWLVKEALGRGLDTYAGIRDTSSRALLTDERINFFTLDFEDEALLERQLGEHQFDIIIHNAGVTRTHKDSIYFKVNCDYSVMFANLALRVLGEKLKKFVFISSIEAFGSADNTPDGVVNESIHPSPRTTYGKSKLRAEKKLKLIKKLPLIILRPTAVFGPGEKDLFMMWQTIRKYRISPIIGDGLTKYTFVYVKDLVRVVIDASISSIIRRSYFVSDGRIHSIRDFTGHIAHSLEIKPYSIKIPFGVLDMVVGATALADKITGKKSLLNEEQLAKMKALNWDCDISDLIADFNYQAQYNLQQAIIETTTWYERNNWL